METRRLLIAALLSLAVLLLWQKLFPPPPVVAPAPMDGGAAAPPGEPAPSPPPVATAEVAESAAAESAAAAPSGPPVEAATEQTVVLEDERIRAVWSNRGAQLVSLELKAHPTDDNGPVDLVRRRVEEPYLFGLVAAGGAPSALDQALFAVERARDGATFTYRGPAGASRKTVTLRADSMMDVVVESDGDWRLLLGPGIRNPTPAEAGNRFAQRGAVYLQGGKVERLDALGTDETTVLSATALGFVGLEDQYFLAAAIPGAGLREAVIEPVLFTVDEGGRATFSPRPSDGEDPPEGMVADLQLLLAPAAGRLELAVYFGAKQLDRLDALPGSLGKTVNLGVFGFLARPLLTALRWIHAHIVGNFGWAIILLTVAIRLVLFPLNHKSIVSMEKMQKINPKMQAIRAKYRGKLKDKRGRPNAEASAKMNQEIMALYKAEGVNPAAGCLPMLLQMPVLFAFYRLLSAAVELRHAPWLGWVTDLSVKDPYYVLPLVMGASMVIQQRMAPAQGDPMQRRLFMMMPVVFTVLFLQFPAGMVLYWLTNNVLAIAQQAGYKRWRQRAASDDDGGTK
ncbi:MAG: membrane protein insertase YidC [Acidobacteriota bacterium]|nr:membrane protein insertase YidC [Acidobacteriota bacterium]